MKAWIFMGLIWNNKGLKLFIKKLSVSAIKLHKVSCFVKSDKVSLNRNVQQRLFFSAVPLKEHHSQECNNQRDVEKQENSVNLFRHAGPVPGLLMLLVLKELSYSFLHRPQLFWQPLQGDEILPPFASIALQMWFDPSVHRTKKCFSHFQKI